MKVFCKNCAKTIGNVSDEKIPVNKTVYLKCPKCQSRIPLRRESNEPSLMMEKSVNESASEPEAYPAKSPAPGPKKETSQTNTSFYGEKTKSGKESHPSSASTSGSALTKIAVGLFLILFLFIGLRFWSFAKVYRVYELGPSRVSQNSSSLAIYADNSLYHLDKSGQLLKKIELEKLGLAAPIADIALLEDNSILIGERSNGKISRCNLEKLVCSDISPTDSFAIEDAFRFLANEKAGIIYISDTLNHRVMIHEIGGSYTKIIDRDVSFPNAMTIDGDSLFLCDTYNSRVMRYTIEKDGYLDRYSVPFISIASLTSLGGLKNMADMTPQELRAHLEKLKTDEGMTGIIDRPMTIAKDASGKWWLGVTSEADMFGSEVQIYSPEGDKISNLPDPDNALAEDITLLNGEMLITDPELMRVYTVNPETYFAADFGGEELSEALDSLRTQKGIASFFKQWSTKFMLLIGACLLGLLFYLKMQEG